MGNQPGPWANIRPTTNVDPKQGPTAATYYELWGFFEERGGLDKERMITIVTWLLAFAAALIGYIATNHVTYDGMFCVTRPAQLTIFSLIGIAICALAMKLIWEFATHARSNFIKTDYCKRKIPGLDPIFEAKVGDDDLITEAQINEDPRYSLSPKRVGRIFRNLNLTSLGVGVLFALLPVLLLTNTIQTCSLPEQSDAVQTQTPDRG